MNKLKNLLLYLSLAGIVLGLAAGSINASSPSVDDMDRLPIAAQIPQKSLNITAVWPMRAAVFLGPNLDV